MSLGCALAALRSCRVKLFQWARGTLLMPSTPRASSPSSSKKVLPAL